MSGEHGAQSSDASQRATDTERDGTLTIVVAAAAVLFVLLGIGSPLIGQRVFLGTDNLARIAPWRSVTEPPTPINPCVGDTTDAIFPWRAEFRNRVWDGDFPLWNASVSGGSQLGSVPDSGMLSPLNLAYWIFPLWLAPAISKLIELTVAIGFSYLFLRRLVLSRPAALMGGLVYAASGFMVVWTNWPQSQVAALIPALFWATERFLQERTIRAAMPISIVAALMLLQGFPAVTGWSIYAVGAYVAVRWLTRRGDSLLRGARDLAAVAGALVLGLGIAAVQIVPFLNRLPEIAEERGGGDGLPGFGLATMAVPTIFGSCGGHGELGLWGPKHDVELNAFIGVVALVLILVGVTRPAPEGVRRGVRGFFTGAALLTAALLYRGGAPLDAAQRLPVFDINNIGRIRSVLGFFLAVVAAIGLDRLVRRRRSRRSSGRDHLLAAGVCLAGFALVAVIALDARDFAERKGRLADFNDAVMLPVAIALAAVTAVTLCYFLRGRWRTAVLATLPFLFLAQALPWVWSFWPRSDRESFYPESSAHDFLSERLSGDRFVAEGLTMYPFAAGVYGLRSVTGHTFTDERWEEALAAVDPEIWRSRTFSALPHEPALAGSPMFDRLAARYFAAAPEFPLIGPDPERLSLPVGDLALRPNRPIRAALPTTGLRGVGVVLARPTPDLGQRAEILVELTDAAGTVRARGSRLLPPGLQPGDFLVALPREVDGVDANVLVEARITLRHASSSLELAADELGEPVLVIQRVDNDGLDIVFNDGVVIYERTGALPRIRWASSVRLIGDERDRLEYLANEPVEADEVVLSVSGPEPTGLPAGVEVLEDSGDTIRVRVDAEGAGYLTIADPLGSGWTAEVDGRAAEIVEADHAGGAVFVETGEHEVALRYVPDGWYAGIALSALSLVICVVLWIWGDRLVGRRRSTGSPS
jgi:hypothetical protein